MTPPPDFEEREIGGFWVVWTDAHAPRLARLADHFDLVWATTWEHYANQALCPALGLDPLPVIRFQRGKTQTRKLDTIMSYVGDRPAAWIDDDLYEDAHSWARARDESIPTLLLQTIPSVGFTNEHVEELIAFAMAVNEDMTST